MGRMGGRRDFLKTLGAIGAGALVAEFPAAAQSPARGAGRIDVHHHVMPPKYLAELKARNLATADQTNWSVSKTLDDMDQAGVTTAIASVTAPAVSFAEPAIATHLARESNEWMAGLRRDYPGRFGLFARPCSKYCCAARRYLGSCVALNACRERSPQRLLISIDLAVYSFVT